jgi:preprotein translocase subunit SecB
LLVAIIAALATYKYYKPSSAPAGLTQEQQDEANKQTANHSDVVKKDVDVAKLPDRFPSDIPLEADAKVDQNFTAQTQNGQYQATRVFQTTKTLDENYKIYSAYLKSAGWTTIANVDQDKLKVLGAKKGDAFLQININENSVNKIKTVSISYSENPNLPK